MKKYLRKVENFLRLQKHVTMFPERELSFMKLFASDEFDVALDIGANRGYVSWVLSSCSRVVHAVEPQSSMCNYLLDVLPINCELHHVALSDSVGTAELSIPVKGGTSVTAEARINTTQADPIADAQIEAVSVTTLDSLADSIDGSIDFIKVDVEGHEARVIAGGHQTLTKHKPMLMVEVEERHGAEVEKLFETLYNYEYQSFVLTNGILTLVSPMEYLARQRGSNVESSDYLSDVFFVSEEKGG